MNIYETIIGTLLIFILIGTASGGGGGATITVCPSGCEYSSIQKAINTSSSGDTILVKSGTYHENVKVNKQLTLRGIGNPVVDARGSGDAIKLTANGITLEGFTATGSGYYPGAGIKVTSRNNTLTGNKIYNNIFNNTKNFRLEKSNTQAWNTPRQSGTNIIAGPYLGQLLGKT